MRPGIRGSHSEFAVTQLLVDLPTKFGHVLLSEAEWLRQGQVLAILGVNKAGHENHLLSIPPPNQDLCYIFCMIHISLDLSENIPISQRKPRSHRLGLKRSLTLKPVFLFDT